MKIALAKDFCPDGLTECSLSEQINSYCLPSDAHFVPFLNPSLTDRYGLGSEGKDLPELRWRDRPHERTAGRPEVGPGSQPHGHRRVGRPGPGGGGVLRHRRGRGRGVHAVQAPAAAAPAAGHLDGEGVEAVGARGRGSLPGHAVNL